MFRRLCPFFLAAANIIAQPANPARLSYATYVGSSSGGSIVNGLAVDALGNSYVTGSYSGCAFLTKLNQTGTAAIWSICAKVSQVNAIALDASGYIYVAGVNQPFDSVSVGSSTVIKLSSDGNTTVYSTPIAGTYASSLVLDRAGNAYLTGLANSTFLATPGAFLMKVADPLAGLAGFAIKLNPSGAIQYATYLDFADYAGGSANDIAVA